MLKRWIEINTGKVSLLVDMEFMLSQYECSWGKQCKGINPERPDLGCCANGAFLHEDDEKLLARRVPLLTSGEWQRKGTKYTEEVKEKNRFGINRKTGEKKTALQNPEDQVSGCVFANDTNFSGGAGCALHIAALNRGENPLDWKPSICWQMPLYVEEVEDMDLFILRMFHWTKDDYPWFCAHDEVSWVGQKPLFRTMNQELKALLDSIDTELYDKVVALCETAYEQSLQWQGKKAFAKPVPVTLTYKY